MFQCDLAVMSIHLLYNFLDGAVEKCDFEFLEGPEQAV
jgi:hypothetical protein